MELHAASENKSELIFAQALSFQDANKPWDDGIVSAAAVEAKHHKADAIIIRQGAEFGVSKIAGAKNDPLVLWSNNQTTALVVRWLTPQEISDRRLLLDEFLKRFSANDLYMSIAINAVAKEGYDLAGMTPDEIVMKRPVAQ